MNKVIFSVETIRKYSPEVGGVFTLSDLRGLFPFLPANVFYRKIKVLESSGVLKRFSRGIYITKDFNITVLSQKICPESYISFETVLARNLIIGTMPSKGLRGVKVGKKREYISEGISITHFEIDRGLFFGFETVEGVNFALKEKALLDTLYFYNKGIKFYFDIYSDIDLKRIDAEVVKKYLSKYSNPKFMKFVNSYLKEVSV